MARRAVKEAVAIKIANGNVPKGNKPNATRRRPNGEAPKYRTGVPVPKDPASVDVVPHFRRDAIAMQGPCKLTEAIVDEVYRLLPHIAYIDTIGDYLAIHRVTWRRWVIRGRKAWNEFHNQAYTKIPKEEQLYFRLFVAYKQGRAAGVANATENIANAGKKHWQAAAWWLERTDSARWGQKNKIEVTGKDGGEIKQVQIFLPDNGRGRPPMPIVQGVAKQVGHIIEGDD